MLMNDQMFVEKSLILIIMIYQISSSGWPDIQLFFTIRFRLRFWPNCRQILDISGSCFSLSSVFLQVTWCKKNC